jgi:hypothetical protein
MTIPKRKLQQRGRLPMGALRWLLGATPEWIYEKGDCTHGSIVRWKHLILHVHTSEDWDEFQEQYWSQWRNSILQWHKVRGYKLPPPYLRGHELERRWLWQHRRKHPRARVG